MSLLTRRACLLAATGIVAVNALFPQTAARSAEAPKPPSSPAKITQIGNTQSASTSVQGKFDWRNSEDVVKYGTPRFIETLEDMARLQKEVIHPKLQPDFQKINIFDNADYGAKLAKDPWDVRTLEQLKIALTTGVHIGYAYGSKSDGIYSEVDKKESRYRQFAVDCAVIVLAGKDIEMRKLAAALLEDYVRFKYAMSRPNESGAWLTQAYNGLPRNEAWDWSVSSTSAKFSLLVPKGYDGAKRQEIAENLVYNVRNFSVADVAVAYRKNNTFLSSLRADILIAAEEQVGLLVQANKTPKIAMGLNPGSQ